MEKGLLQITEAFSEQVQISSNHPLILNILEDNEKEGVRVPDLGKIEENPIINHLFSLSLVNQVTSDIPPITHRDRLQNERKKKESTVCKTENCHSCHENCKNCSNCHKDFYWYGIWQDWAK